MRIWILPLRFLCRPVKQSRAHCGMCPSAHTTHVTSARVMKCACKNSLRPTRYQPRREKNRNQLENTHYANAEASSAYVSTSSTHQLPDHIDNVCKQTVHAEHKHISVRQRSCPSRRPPCCTGIVGSSHVCARVAWERCSGKCVSRSCVYIRVFFLCLTAVNTLFVMEGQGEAIGWAFTSTFAVC